MAQHSMCRICLAIDVRMHSVVGVHLQELYESLSKMPFATQDNRPIQACYICFARLKNCYRLKRSCMRSEELLTHMLNNKTINTQILTKNSFSKNLQIVHPVFEMDIGETQEHIQLKIKQEPSSLFCDVKIEPVDNQENEVHEASVIRSSEKEYDVPIEVVKMDHEPMKHDNKCFQVGVCHKISSSNDFAYFAIKQEPPNDMDVEENQFSSNAIVDVRLNSVKREPIPDTSLYNADLLRPSSSRPHPEAFPLKHTNSKLEKILQQEKQQCTNSINTIAESFPACERREDDQKTSSKSSNTKKNNKKMYSQITNIKIGNHEVLAKCVGKKCNDNMPVVKQFICDICQRIFIRKPDLTRHMLVHTGVKAYQCDICKKRFSKKPSLNIHKRVHSGEKPYKCDTCIKCFNNRSDLNKHYRIHTGVKPYNCNLCEKRFIQKSELNKHIRTHTDERPFQCNVCQKRFNYKQILDTHFLTHTGEKPYQCDVCLKRFRQRGDWRKHVRIHTGERPFSCHICNKRFNIKSNLKTHMVRLHAP